METITEIALVFTEVLKNNPFTKSGQIDRFRDLAITNFESIQIEEFPCDEFYEWWKEKGIQKAEQKYHSDSEENFEEDNLEEYLMAEEVNQWYKSTWMVEMVLSEIPN
jgi:hypothetical protein